jgi:hypothetical protein
MKNKNYLLIALLSLIFFSCQKNANKFESEKTTVENTNQIELSITTNDSVTLSNYGETLKLGLIGLIGDTRFRSILNDSMPLYRYDDRISFTILKSIYNNSQNDLLTAMSNSATNNGGSLNLISVMSNFSDSFQIGNYYFRPILNIPFSNEVNLTLNPFIGKSWVHEGANIMVKDFVNITTYNLNESNISTAMNNPNWIVSFRFRKINDQDWKEYLPWRRCTCPRVIRPDGTIPSNGTCGGYYDGYAPVCGRANFLGKCEGGNCKAGIEIADISPIFN